MKKVALITGAVSGIGKATALKFVEKGYRIAISDCNDRGVNVLGQQIIERGGVFIYVSSILGTLDTSQKPAYMASKHGLVGFPKVVTLDYAENDIWVNAVGTRYIETPMLKGAEILSDQAVGLHSLGRLGIAEVVANAIVWLGSDEASPKIGHTLLVDGGFIAQ